MLGPHQWKFVHQMVGYASCRMKPDEHIDHHHHQVTVNEFCSHLQAAKINNRTAKKIYFLTIQLSPKVAKIGWEDRYTK